MQLINAYIRLLRAIYEAFTHQLVLALFSVNLLLVSIASVIYMHIEGWGFIQALYFSVITISTVGYGDLVPATPMGKLFTSGYIFIGAGFFFLAVGAFAEDVIKYIREHR